jgi:hypothetical protein
MMGCRELCHESSGSWLIPGGPIFKSEYCLAVELVIYVYLHQAT